TPSNSPTNTPLRTQTPVGSSATPAPTGTPTVIVPSATPTPTPTLCTLSFSDVQPGSTFYPYVRCLACLGIISGYREATFRPGNNVTRGQLAKILSNAAGYNDTNPSSRQTFDDVPYDNT